MERIAARVRGDVQGVGYRAFVRESAQATGVSGYVRNLPDGTVEILAEGSVAALEDFLRIVRAADDPFIRVTEIRIERMPATEEFAGFRIAW